MRQITLSDHTADKVQQAGQQREDKNAERVKAYELEREKKQRTVDEAKVQMRDAWGRRKLFAAIGHALRLQWRALFGWPRRPKDVTTPTRDEQIWRAGHAGEADVMHSLARKLSDDWILVCGYRNRGGEIDQVLIGPNGLFAIEVKHINGRVHIVGDQWTSDKYDNYGNVVETGKSITDNGGRSPSRQINESADKMVEFLHKTLPHISCQRLVVLSHPKAAIQSVSNPTVFPVVLAHWNLEKTLLKNAPVLDPVERSKIVDLLKRDHDFHQKRRGPAGQPRERAAAVA